jgi:hypothetical protein
MKYMATALLCLIATEAALGNPPKYGAYGKALASYVDDQGGVDYRGLKAHSQELNAFLDSIAQLTPAEYSPRTDEEKIAFWLNAYNGLTLKAILDHYPVTSIRDIEGVWKKLRFTVMGTPMTLDSIEHEVLRVQFNEPRIHAALVCAAKSCPPLRNEPYHGSKLNDQLDDQMRKFLSSPSRFNIDPPSNTVFLSEIFKWFGEDFLSRYAKDAGFKGLDPKERAVLNAVSRYVRPEVATFLQRGGYRVDYLPYDWSLNER